jgi:predicted metal-binding protein
MKLLEKFKEAERLLEFAKDCEGVSRVELISARDVVVDERVRFQCSHSGCREYGKRFMCPPYVPEVEEFKKLLSKYLMAIILQVEGQTAGETADEEAKRLALLLHEAVYRTEKQAFSSGFPFAAGFIGGPCILCEKCPAGDGHKYCVRREKARPSMEAMGIDVLKTCEKAGLKIAFMPGKVVWTGMILLD